MQSLVALHFQYNSLISMLYWYWLHLWGKNIMELEQYVLSLSTVFAFDSQIALDGRTRWFWLILITSGSSSDLALFGEILRTISCEISEQSVTNFNLRNTIHIFVCFTFLGLSFNYLGQQIQVFRINYLWKN